MLLWSEANLYYRVKPRFFGESLESLSYLGQLNIVGFLKNLLV